MRLLRSALTRLRDSLFIVPVAMILVAGGLAGLSLLVDSRNLEYLAPNPLILSATVSGGRAIATTVAGATITVAAIVFSITALLTQEAATQYSPRSVGGFIEDLFQQSVIGLVLGTFTFSLVILAGLNDVLDQTEEATPTLSVTLAIGFGVVSAIAIVAYIDHSMRRMQIDNVVRRIAGAALEAVRHEQRERQPNTGQTRTGPPQGASSRVRSSKEGWVVGIDGSRLLAALPPRATASVEVRVGKAVARGDHVATVWADSGNLRLTPQAEREIEKAIQTDAQRSEETDAAFGIRQLADIALRAISPAVNDPTTAVDVIQHLKVPLREILAAVPPLRVLEGPEGRRAFLSETPSRSDYVHYAFSEIRLSASSQPLVLRALLEVLHDLKADFGDKSFQGRLAAVEEEFRLTMDAALKSDLPEPDIQRIVHGYREEDLEDA
ncbi:MAG: DUF2254 domain-containing protein [Acidimicrobiia bacterium]